MKFFIFILSLISCSHACASDKLITLYLPFSSGIISTDEIILDLLIDKLPDYKLKKLNMSLERSLRFMTKNNKDSCIQNMRKTPQRESAFYFSYPETLFLGLKAYLSPRVSLLFRKRNNISINDFIVKNKLIIGVDKERSYNSSINAQILKLPNQNKYIKEGSASEERMAQMLFSNRIDVWLEYPTVMEVYKEKYLGDNQIISLSVLAADDLVTGHIACNKTANNKLFINAINQSLLKLYQEKSYYEAHTQFIHKNLEEKFSQSFNDFFIKFK